MQPVSQGGLIPDITLADREIRERFVPCAGSQSRTEARGDAGVELRLDIVRASLPEDVKTRLLALGGRRVTAQGELVVVSRADRSREHNREAARDRFAGIIRAAATPPKQRLRLPPPRPPRPPRRAGKVPCRASPRGHRRAVRARRSSDRCARRPSAGSGGSPMEHERKGTR